MFKTEHLVLALVIVLSVTFIGVAAVQQDVAAEPAQPSVNPSPRHLAEQFVMNEATFAFDGVDGSLALMSVTRAGERQIFTFHFECLHGGYGDRSGLVSREGLTPHRAVIQVESGQVVSALMDGRWDMLTQTGA
jgi:hypothetical protein